MKPRQADFEMLARTRVVKIPVPQARRSPPATPQPLAPLPVLGDFERTARRGAAEEMEPTTEHTAVDAMRPTTVHAIVDEAEPTGEHTAVDVMGTTVPRAAAEQMEPTTAHAVVELRKPVVPRATAEVLERTVPCATAEVLERTVPRAAAEGLELTVPRAAAEELEPTTAHAVVELRKPVALRMVTELLEPTALRPAAERQEPTVPRAGADGVEPTTAHTVVELRKRVAPRMVIELLEPTALRPVAGVLERPAPRPVAEVQEPTVIWTRSDTPAPKRTQHPGPARGRGFPPAAARGPAPERRAGSAADVLRSPAPERRGGSSPELARNPAPERRAASSPHLAGSPAPERRAASSPQLAGNPAPERRAGSAPQLAGNPAPERRAGSAPQLAGGPAPERRAGSAPQLAGGPAPERRAGSSPPMVPSPAAVLAPAPGRGSVPAHAQGSAPAALGLAPEIEREVFQVARRIALQADLPAAARALQQGMSQLTESPDAMCVLFDPALCSAWAVPDGGAPRKLDDRAQQLIAQVAVSGQRVLLGRALIEPVGPAPARAVLVVRRPPASPAYGVHEVATLAAIAASVVGIVGHFVADHGARRAQELRDEASPFRPEAPPQRRGGAAAPGRLVAAPRTWMRWAYPTLIGLVVAVIAATAIIQVPTYSTGVSIIMIDGEHVTAPMAGTVAEVLVAPGAHVAAGDPLVRLHAVDEEAELAATETDYRNALAMFLTNPGDDTARNALAGIATRRQRARAIVDARTLRASTAGVVGDIRVRPGQLLVPSAQVMKVSTSAEPSVVALLPGFDRPRLEVGMTLQIELPRYHKRRELAVIDSIGSQVIGPDEARRSLGDPIGDALPIAGPVVLVRAHLAARTFMSGGREYEFHDGMLGKAEVKVSHESLLRMLIPGAGE